MGTMEYQSEVLCVIQQNSLFYIPSSFHSLTFSIRIISPSLLVKLGMLLTFITKIIFWDVKKKKKY